jgi:hypothetical protein
LLGEIKVEEGLWLKKEVDPILMKLPPMRPEVIERSPPESLFIEL